MAVAFATFFTSSNLAGHMAAGDGFNVSATGTGNKTVNIGARGAAFRVAENSTLTLVQILLAPTVCHPSQSLDSRKSNPAARSPVRQQSEHALPLPETG